MSDIEKLMAPLCYGIAQGTNARIANNIRNGIRLDPDDSYYQASKVLSDPGEHISGIVHSVTLMCDYIPDGSKGAFSDMEERACVLVSQYNTGMPIGAAINSLRIALVRFLRTLPKEFTDKLIALLGSAEPPIYLDLYIELNEGGGKP